MRRDPQPAYSLQAAAKGLRSLGRTTDMLAPIRPAAPSCGAIGRRSCGDAGKLLRRCRSLALVARSEKPRRRGGHLVDKLKLPQAMAANSLDLMAEPGFGFARDAKFDLAGFENVLALRAEVQGGQPAIRSATRSQLLRSAR